MFYSIVKSIFRLFFLLFYPYKVEGRDNIPSKGPLIVCSNHISWLDPPLIGVIMPRKVHFMAKEELFDIFLLGAAIKKLDAFPVKRGSADLKTIKTALKHLKNKEFLSLFPEGTRSKTGEIGEALPGVALIALKSEAPVLPAAIKGRYKLFRKVKVNIGKPLVFPAYYGQKAKKELLEEISSSIMNEIKRLRTTV
ncbi:MAG TPA: 1-acyl-sn-glycerol-3-phosphate acyltransferase [Firmicutes bacterium]|nr:1-acyl-sn-glycerol-3-phosphate acyltransferase [Bacillota bacterium]